MGGPAASFLLVGSLRLLAFGIFRPSRPKCKSNLQEPWPLGAPPKRTPFGPPRPAQSTPPAQRGARQTAQSIMRGTPRPCSQGTGHNRPDPPLHCSLYGWTLGLFIILKAGLSPSHVQTQQVSPHGHLDMFFHFCWGSA